MRTPLFLVSALVFFSAAIARAEIKVTVDPAGAQQLGLQLSDLETQLSDELTAAFNLLKPKDYVRALTDAQAFSNKGLGVDYASNPTAFVVGVAGNFAVSLGDKGLGERYSERPIVGSAPNVSVMAGLNMDLIGMDWLTLYGNFFTQALTIEEVSGNLLNWGIHAQVKFFRPQDDGLEILFQWGGIDFTTGYEYSRLKLDLEKQLDTPLPLAGGVAATEALFGGIGTFNITTTANTIPVELSTNFRLFYVLTLFMGAGYDIQLGNGKMTINLDGDLTAANPMGGDDIDLGTANVIASESSKPTEGLPRLMAGVQINLSMVKIFVQLNAIPPDRAISGGGGLRIAW